MNTKVIKGVFKAVGVLQRRTFPLHTSPRFVSTKFSKPLAPRVYAAQPHAFTPFRWLSTTSQSLEEGRIFKTDYGWKAGEAGDVEKWNKRMDELAEESETNEESLLKWADLLEEGVAAHLPGIEDTIRRNTADSPTVSAYVDSVLEEDELEKRGADYPDEYDEDDEIDDESELYSVGEDGDEDFEDEDGLEDEDYDEGEDSEWMNEVRKRFKEREAEKEKAREVLERYCEEHPEEFDESDEVKDGKEHKD